MEKIAKKYYEDCYNVKIVEFGVIVKFDQPWLCTSLDGAVVQNNQVVRLLEIKCPFSCSDKNIVDVENKKCNVPYLVYEDGVVTLRKSNKIYTQTQVQMYITGQKECDLLVYIPKKYGSRVIRILRNEDFLKPVISQCEIFYFNNSLPMIVKTLNDTKNKQRTFDEKDIINTYQTI